MSNDKSAVFSFVQSALERSEEMGADVGISEMVYRQLFSAIAQAMTSGDTHESMRSLFQYVCEAYEYRDADELEGFALGACWGALSSAEAFAEEEMEAEAESKAREVASRYHKLLSLVLEQPGITHADLARRVDSSPSNLTQMLNRVKKYGLITANKVGRSKHYALSRRGKALVSANEEARRRQAAMTNNFDAFQIEQMLYRRLTLRDGQAVLESFKDELVRAIPRETAKLGGNFKAPQFEEACDAQLDDEVFARFRNKNNVRSRRIGQPVAR